MPATISRRTGFGHLAVVLAPSFLAACASHVWVAPRLDLQPLRPTGLVTFTIENAQGTLHEVATRRFADAAFAGQNDIEILELGDADRLLAEVGEHEFTPQAARTIGAAHSTPAFFVGHLIVSNVTPRGVLSPLAGPRVEASVNVELTVRLISTATGGTLWSRSARATETVGELGLSGGNVYFGAEHPDEAYGRLVDRLVDAVTADLRPRRVRK